MNESSPDGQRETYLWPHTHWKAIPHVGRIYYRKALPELPRHRHDNAYEIIFLREGTLMWEISGQPIRFAAGDLLVVSPSLEHGGVWSMMQPCRLDFLQLNASLRDRIFRRLLEALSSLAGRPQSAGPEVGPAFDRILAEVRHKDAWSEATMEASVLLLLSAVARKPTKGSGRFSGPVAAIARWMEDHPEEWLTTTEAARIARLGSSQLQARFKRETGLSLNAFALERRLSKARTLLATGITCTSVALELGFSSSQYFATAFKRQYGISPGSLGPKHRSRFNIRTAHSG